MDRIQLKYGINPAQGNASVYREGGLPLDVLNGRPGYINFLDALNGWQLVRDLRKVTGLPAAASFKHVSPAGAAVAVPLSDTERRMYFQTKAELSPLAVAYVRARGADRMSSFGDFIALSDSCDALTAKVISKEVSDGVIAPGYSDEALEILKGKKKGSYVVLRIDPAFEPEEADQRTIFGITFTQDKNPYLPSDKDFGRVMSKNKELTEDGRRDLTVALLALKYTQSNSVCYAYNGQTIGVGAGQQSRIHCTRLAGDKADHWLLRRSDRVLALPFRKGLSRNDKDNCIEQYLSAKPEIDVVARWEDYFTEPVEPYTEEEKDAYIKGIKGIALASDAFFPFRDNIDRAVRSGVSFIAEPGGSVRDDLVIEAADEHGVFLCFSTTRLFHH